MPATTTNNAAKMAAIYRQALETYQRNTGGPLPNAPACPMAGLPLWHVGDVLDFDGSQHRLTSCSRVRPCNAPSETRMPIRPPARRGAMLGTTE